MCYSALGRLFMISGGSIGLALLVLSEIYDDRDVGRWGIAVICVTCTYSVHRRLTMRDNRLAEAFRLGQMSERARHQDGEMSGRLTSVR